MKILLLREKFFSMQAYMSRLGLWGAGSAFPDFSSFLESMKKRGVSFLEVHVPMPAVFTVTSRCPIASLSRSVPAGYSRLKHVESFEQSNSRRGAISVSIDMHAKHDVASKATGVLLAYMSIDTESRPLYPPQGVRCSLDGT